MNNKSESNQESLNETFAEINVASIATQPNEGKFPPETPQNAPLSEKDVPNEPLPSNPDPVDMRPVSGEHPGNERTHRSFSASGPLPDPPNPPTPASLLELDQRIQSLYDEYRSLKNPSQSFNQFVELKKLRLQRQQLAEQLTEQQRQQAAEQELDLEFGQDSRSPIDLLPPAEQRKLFNLLQKFSAPSILKKIAQPRPAGFGLQTSDSSLDRFKRRYQKRTLAQQNLDAREIAGTVLEDPLATEAIYTAASARLLNIRLLQRANDPDAGSAELSSLFRAQARHRALELAARRLDLAERKQQPDSQKQSTE